MFFFFNDTATTEIYTLSLHDALPISTKWCAATWPAMPPPRFAGVRSASSPAANAKSFSSWPRGRATRRSRPDWESRRRRSEEHTSELQSLAYLACRLLLEKKKYGTVH